jgi:hypothetical protein
MRKRHCSYPWVLVLALGLLSGCDGSKSAPPPRDSGSPDRPADSSSRDPGDASADVVADSVNRADLAAQSDVGVDVATVPDAADSTDLVGPSNDAASEAAKGFDAGGGSEASTARTDAAVDTSPILDAGVEPSVRLDAIGDSPADRNGDRASDAETGSEAGASVSWTLNLLDYRVLDAEYSDSLDSIVFVTDSPDRALHIYNPVTGSDVRVALPLGAMAVSVSPAGDKAAVAHDAHLTYVDLLLGTILKTCDVKSDAIDIVLADNGWAYVFPMTDQWSQIHGIMLDNCSETLSVGSSIYAGTVAKLHPGGTKLYGADRRLSPSDIERYDITNGPPICVYDSPYHGDYPMCGNLWISSDGLRIFTACGRVFRASDTRSEDMTYNGRLESVDSIRHLAHATAQGKVLVIPLASTTSYLSNPNGDTLLRIHDYQFLTLDRTVALPSIPGQGTTVFKAHGQFVFAKADGSAYYVVLQADTSSGLLNDFAVATMVP